jgi:hypothetical protein
VLVSKVIAGDSGEDAAVIVNVLPVFPLKVEILAEAERPTLVLITVGFEESKRIGPETVSVTVCAAVAPTASVTVIVSR